MTRRTSIPPLRPSGWSATVSAATRPAPSPGSSPAATTVCWLVALPVPLGRTVMLDDDRDGDLGRRAPVPALGAGQIADEDAVADAGHLEQFRLELGLPVWRFAFDGITVERRLVALHGQNTVLLFWRLAWKGRRPSASACVRLPMSGHSTRGSTSRADGLRAISQGDRHELAVGPIADRQAAPEGRCRVASSSTAASAGKSSTLGRRGAATTVAAASGVRVTSRSPWRRADRRSPFDRDLGEGDGAAPGGSGGPGTRPPACPDRRRPPGAREGPAAELVLAADSFIVRRRGASRVPLPSSAIRSARDRRLSLVHRLGSGHDDQP